MSIGARYSNIMRKALMIPLITIIAGIILYHFNIVESGENYGEHMLWIGIIALNAIPLLGLLLLLIHYINIGDKKTLSLTLIIVLFILINILINIFG